MQLNDVKDTMHTIAGVTVSVSLWLSAGMEFVNWGDEFSLRPYKNGHGASLSEAEMEGQIIEARVTTGDTGEKAVVWLIAERRRQAEERARNNAAYESAEAQKKAGDAAIHAARIHRQAEELRCLAAGVDKRSIDSRLG